MILVVPRLFQIIYFYHSSDTK